MDKHDVLEQHFVIGSPTLQICWSFFEGVRKPVGKKVKPLQPIWITKRAFQKNSHQRLLKKLSIRGTTEKDLVHLKERKPTGGGNSVHGKWILLLEFCRDK